MDSPSPVGLDKATLLERLPTISICKLKRTMGGYRWEPYCASNRDLSPHF